MKSPPISPRRGRLQLVAGGSGDDGEGDAEDEEPNERTYLPTESERRKAGDREPLDTASANTDTDGDGAPTGEGTTDPKAQREEKK
mmetsp:Transcript_15124/g.30599  ORF Transcript_15124/g.30599 Transcript_15124/m.30599 type:complete len:86 (-) Transcript_15124:210-467(-)